MFCFKQTSLGAGKAHCGLQLTLKRSSPKCDASLWFVFQHGSGSGILGVKWIRCNASNLLSTPCKILFGMPPTSGKGQTQFFIQVPEKERKGLGRSGVSRGAIAACRSNTNKGLSPGSLQNSLLTLQQHHDCKKAGDIYGPIGKTVKVTTRAMHVRFWTHKQAGISEGQFAHGQLPLRL